MLDSFSIFLLSADLFFQINVFNKLFQEYHLSGKEFGPTDQARQNFGPNLGPNYLQKFLAENSSR